jgi:hypothetical protein
MQKEMPHSQSANPEISPASDSPAGHQSAFYSESSRRNRDLCRPSLCGHLTIMHLESHKEILSVLVGTVRAEEAVTKLIMERAFSPLLSAAMTSWGFAPGAPLALSNAWFPINLSAEGAASYQPGAGAPGLKQ